MHSLLIVVKKFAFRTFRFMGAALEYNYKLHIGLCFRHTPHEHVTSQIERIFVRNFFMISDGSDHH